MRKIAIALAAVVGLSLAPSQLPSQAAPAQRPAPVADQVDAPVPELTWRKCWGGEFQCARADVPLDYDDPTGPTTTISLLKAPARKPDRKIGSLFVNPGGPGGGAAEFAAFFPQLVRPAVANRFDIIGIDPRGVTKPYMKCVTNEDEPETSFQTPANRRQAARIFAWDDWARGACETGYSPITAHMTTADTARDMDLIRQSLGEEKLTYYGVSYGTYLGATYAAMFPDRVRAMIVDGVLDPVAWATGEGNEGSTIPFSTRLGSGYGAYDALTSAFAACDRVGKPRCALAGNSERKWVRLLDALKEKPYKGLTWRGLIDYMLGGLYSAEFYPYVMQDIKFLHKAVVVGDGRGARVADRLVNGDVTRQVNERRGVPARILDRVRGGGPMSWWGQQPVSLPFQGVACADTDNPTDPWAWWDQGLAAEEDAPWFTMTWTFASSTCAGWRETFKDDRYDGPWNIDTPASVLIVGNTHDPATPIHGARALHEQFSNSQLLTVKAWGHGAIGGVSRCVDDAYAAYLVGKKLPAPGTDCRADRPLFPARN